MSIGTEAVKHTHLKIQRHQPFSLTFQHRVQCPGPAERTAFSSIAHICSRRAQLPSAIHLKHPLTCHKRERSGNAMVPRSPSTSALSLSTGSTTFTPTTSGMVRLFYIWFFCLIYCLRHSATHFNN